MHDFRVLRDQVDALRSAMRRRGKLDVLAPLIDRGVALDLERRTMIQAVEERKAARNANSQEVARRKKAKEDADALIANGRALGEGIAQLESELARAEQELQSILLELPNLTLDEVPEGDEGHNAIVKSWGEPRAADGCKPHWELAEALGILDLARGAKISGSGFIVLRGTGARLTRALMNLFIDTHTREHGYEEVWVPVVVNRASMTGTGQLPKFEDDMYGIAGEDLFLVPTAEVPVTNLYRDEMLEAGELPRGFVAYTPCFRKEAGAAGKDTRGLLRLHQFDKVEIVQVTHPDHSYQVLEEMRDYVAGLLAQLELPYRVVRLCGGDMSFTSALTYDMEVWSSAQGRWLEVSSVSNFEAFQANVLKLRFKDEQGKMVTAHTLNGSALALPRIMAALLENNQTPDGIRIPAVLGPYTGFDRIGS